MKADDPHWLALSCRSAIMSKIVGIAVASTALNGALSLWLVALRRRLRKRTKDAQENKRDKDAGVKRTNSDGAMVSMELLKSIAWQQYPSYTRPSALQEVYSILPRTDLPSTPPPPPPPSPHLSCTNENVRGSSSHL